LGINKVKILTVIPSELCGKEPLQSIPKGIE